MTNFFTLIGAWVKQRVIIVYCLFEITVCTGLAMLFIKVPSIAQLDLLGTASNHMHLSMMSLRVVVSLVALRAACLRKVCTMRCYFWCLPIGAALLTWMYVPLSRTLCDCSTFLQCKILVEISQGRIVNEFPDVDLQEPFPSGSFPTHYESRRLDNIVPSTPRFRSNRSLDFELRMRADLSKESAALDMAFSNESVEFRRLQKHTKGGKVGNGDEAFDGETLGSAGAMDGNIPAAMEASLARHCTCDGTILNRDGSMRKRPSCRAYVKQGRRLMHWCMLRKLSRRACFNDDIEYFQEIDTDFFWSTQLCMRRQCGCSRQGIQPRNIQVLPDVSKHSDPPQYGNHCRLWRPTDKYPWCFVGFDTTCADRTVYSIKPATAQVLSMNEFSQFESRIPCQEKDRESARFTCLIVIAIYSLLLTLLNLFALPMSIIVWRFLLNRCGDEVETQIQFEVDWSDQESVNDFDVDSPDTFMRELEAYPSKLGTGLDKDDKKGSKANEEKKEKKDRKAKKLPKQQTKEKNDENEKKEKKHKNNKDETEEIELC